MPRAARHLRENRVALQGGVSCEDQGYMLSTRAICRRTSFVVAILAALIGSAAYAAPSDIEVVGSSHSDADVIRSYFAGTSEAEVQAGLEALKASGRFTNVSVSRSGGHVVVRVSEGTQINRVVLEGNSKVKSDTLQTELRTKAHGSFSPQIADQDVARVTEIYKRSGRAAAKVTYRTVALPNGRIRRGLHHCGRRQDWR